MFLSSAPSDQELMTLMMTRVAQLEQKGQFQAKEMADKVHIVTGNEKTARGRFVHFT